MAEEKEIDNIEEKDPLVPGTYQIRKITSRQSSMELLATAEHLAVGGYHKKLFSVLSRVYTEHKGFHAEPQDGMEELLRSIISSDIPAELKLQTYTSFEIPESLKPDVDTVRSWVEACAPKRANIAGFFLAMYHYGAECYPLIIKNKVIFQAFFSAASGEDALRIFECVADNENKESITSLLRMVRSTRRRFSYTDSELLKAVTKKTFASKEVFYTSKLIYCLAYSIPADHLPGEKELNKILKICVNYDEKTTREFVKRYHMEFDMSDAALCRYYLANKKTDKEKALVAKFASHVVLLPEDERGRLIHAAFKRGGLFRMYAGCMQDGAVDEAKQKKFHYTDEQIEWVKSLPGLM